MLWKDKDKLRRYHLVYTKMYHSKCINVLENRTDLITPAVFIKVHVRQAAGKGYFYFYSYIGLLVGSSIRLYGTS